MRAIIRVRRTGEPYMSRKKMGERREVGQLGAPHTTRYVDAEKSMGENEEVQPEKLCRGK